jgi:hypothetical protein
MMTLSVLVSSTESDSGETVAVTAPGSQKLCDTLISRYGRDALRKATSDLADSLGSGSEVFILQVPADQVGTALELSASECIAIEETFGEYYTVAVVGT